MRDAAGRSTELLLGRDDADTDVSNHRGDVAGREDVARAEMDGGATSMVRPRNIWRSNRACKHRACPYNDARTSYLTCEDTQNMCRGTFRENLFGKCEHSPI